MAVKFKTATTGFINTWTQLKNIVSQKSLYNEADYESLSASQKEQYLTMLYQNNDALEQRLGSDYYSEYSDSQTRFANLIAEMGIIDYEQKISTDEGKAALNAQFEQQFNDALANDIDPNNSWITDLVNSKYDGNYAKFLQDYSGEKGFGDLLLEQLPSAQDVTENSFNAAISDLSQKYTEQKSTFDNQIYNSYVNTKQYIKEKLQSNARQQTYENATGLEKTLNTLWQIPAAWIAELGNIVEGVVDVVATVTGGVIELFGGDSTGVQEFIKQDIIALDTAVLNATDASWLSSYAGENVATYIHQIGVSIVDMLPLAIPYAGQAIYYASAAGRTMEAELNQGYEFGEAFTYTVVATAIEYGVESISDSPFFKRGKTMTGKWLDNSKIGKWYTKNKNWATEVVRQSFGEGLEEVVSGIASDIMHGVITGDFTLDTKEGWSELSKSFLIGGMVGGIMAGGNQIYRRSIITRTGAKLTNGNTQITLSVGKAQVVSEYIKNTTKKITDGKKLSTREQARYDILKDLKINAMLDGNGNELAGSKAYNIQELITQISEINKNTKSYRLTIEKGYFDQLNQNKLPDSEQSFEQYAADIKNRAAAAMPEDDAFVEDKQNISEEECRNAYDLSDEADIERAQKDFTTNGIITLSKMFKMFGPDVVTQGIESYAKWADKTIDDVIALLTVGTDQSPLDLVTNSEKDITALKQAFKDADFLMVNPKTATTIAATAKEIENNINVVKAMLQKSKKSKFLGSARGSVKFFVTTDANVSTSFFIDNDLYINANWIAERDINTVKDITTLKLLAQNARLMFNKTATKQLLTDIINRLDLKSRSRDIVEQEMTIVLLYTKNNPLMQQLLAMADSIEDRNALIEYFSYIRKNYANAYVTKASGSALMNISASAKELFDLDSIEESEIQEMTADDILKSYINTPFRAFPGITGREGLPIEVSKLNITYLHFKNKFGFNKELNLSEQKDWLNIFNNPDNYSEEGYKLLKSELEKYQYVPSNTGFEFGTIRTKKSFNELLNYYLDQTCGIILTHNGILSSDDFITKILNITEIDRKLASTDINQLSREPIGKVKDFVTTVGANSLSKEVLDAPIYLQSDNRSIKTAAFASGTPGTGMQIFLNMPSIADTRNVPITVGGIQLLLDEKTGLPIEKDGKYQVTPYVVTTSEAARIFAHEIGHLISMSLNLQGTFNTTYICNAWLRKVREMSSMDRMLFANSIVDWLFDGDELKPERLQFGLKFKDPTSLQSWKKTITSDILSNSDKLSNKFQYLAEYLYNTGFAHELYADGNIAAFARDDLIQSRIKSNTKTQTSVLYLDESFKKNAPVFIKVLDGYHTSASNDDFVQTVNKVLSSPENVTNRIYREIQNIEQLKEEFGVELDDDLINPDFWSGKLYATKTDSLNSRFMSRESLISDIESAYNCIYQDEQFVSGFISNMQRFKDVEPTSNKDYSMVFYNDGSVKSTRDDTAYTNESNISAIAVYHPGENGRPADITIRLNTADLSDLMRTRLKAILSFVPNKLQRRFVAGGRTFTTSKAALNYLRSAPVISDKPEFDTLFDKISETAITTGKQVDYAGDTIYITTDGKIYNTNANMATWNSIAETEKIPSSLLGKYTQDNSGNFITDNPEGITYNLSHLLDDKKIVRLYRNNGFWNAYGIPNKLQDQFIRELNANRKTKSSYIQIDPDRKLFVNTKGDQHIEIHSAGWSNSDFTEVEWKANKWYTAICQIMTTYNINKFEDFKRLGFSNDFVAQLQTASGIERINKYGEKYIGSGGISYQYILDYIADGSNTALSKNILIESTPDTTRDNQSGDWKNNAHIRTVEDAEIYLEKLRASGLLLENDNVIYDNWSDFEKMIAKRKLDPMIVDANTQNAQKIEKAIVTFGKGELLIRLLNADSYTKGRGLDISRDSFRIASSIIFKGLDLAMQPETDLTYESDDGKAKEKVSTTINPEDILLAKESIDPVVEEFAKQILETRDIADPEQRDADLDALLQATYYPKYGEIDMSVIRNIIASERTGAKLSVERRKQIQRNIDRIEAYKQLEEGSTEQLSERRKLIRYYEQLRNFKTRLSSVESSEYYTSLLKSVVEIGGFHSRMSQNFATAYRAYDKISENWTPEQKAKFDKQLDLLKSYREHFLTRKDSTMDVIHMEYPGYYEHYQLLYNMLRNWIAGHKGVTQNYLAEDSKNKMFAEPKSFVAAQTDIINFINKWEADTEFRRSMAARERVKSYTQVRSIRGATYTKPDLEMFKNIPEELRDISQFPKEAQQQYDQLANDIDLLADLLGDAEFITDVTKEYGDDYVYHLQRLYNESIMPDISEFRSESKKDMWTKYMTRSAERLGRSEEQIQNIKEDIAKRMTNKPTMSRVLSVAATEKERRMISYRSYTADRALAMQDRLKDSKPASDQERVDAMKTAYKDIQDFRWVNSKGELKSIYALSSTAAYRVVTAATVAYYELLENPKTKASIEKFKSDIQLALAEKKINRTIPGSKKRELVTIYAPEDIKYSDGTSALERHGRTVYLAEKYIDEKLEPLNKGILKDITNTDIQKLEAYRESIRVEEDAVISYIDEVLNPRIREEFEIKNMISAAATREADIAAGLTVKSSQYNIVFNTEVGHFQDLNGNDIERSRVDLRRLSKEEADKYTAWYIIKGLNDTIYRISKTGNILRGEGKETVIAFKSTDLNSEVKKLINNRRGAVDVLVEDFLPDAEDEDFLPDAENEVPNEEDFVSDMFTSNFIEDPGVFDTIDMEAKKPKGTWSPAINTAVHTETIHNATIKKLLSYEPKVGTDNEIHMSTKDFIEDNATLINDFRNSTEMMEEFVSWIENNPAVPIDSPREALIFALLNQVRTTFNAPEDLRDRAKELVNKLRSRSGRILGMATTTGLTPVDQMIGFISGFMNLTVSERATLETAAELQRNAIKIQDYKAAEKSMEKVLEIVKAHEAELPTSCNIFAKGLTSEERSTRMHNIVEKITSWRYFAMLGAPSTFFTKNIASNVIITGMDKISELIASKLPQGQKLSQNYSFTESQFGRIFGISDEKVKQLYKQEYDKLVKERTIINGRATALTSSETEELEKEARRRTSQVENEQRKTLITLTDAQMQEIITATVNNAEDQSKINVNALTKYINDFIKIRHRTDGKIPAISKIVSRANEYLLKHFGQYTMNTVVQANHKDIVHKMLIDNGLLDAIMNNSVSKYDRGYDVKIGALRQITLDADGKLDDISEKEASILADAINKNAPFKWELINKYYRFIFKTMETGDKKFIKPKIISTVEKLVASNMTDSEVQDLLAGKKEARAKFEDFIAYATNDAMKTYFREDTDFYKKLMQLFPKNPVAQLVLGTLIPFPRMVINTMNTALSYSPVGFVKAWLIASKDTDAFTKLKVNKELGKAITGSSLIAMGAILAAAGIIGFDDDDEYGGAQIIIADKIRIALSDLSPSAIPLIIGATITHSATEGFWAAATNGANALLDATILGEAINIFGGNQDSATFITNSFTSYINQFIPSVFRHVARTIDPAKKDYSRNKAIKVFQRTAAAIPGLSFVVPNKIDPYTGDAVYQNAEASKGWAHILSFVNAFSPAKITVDIESEIEIESEAVGAPTTGPAKTYTINGITYTIDDALYKEYQILRAKLYSSYAKEIINTSRYKNMTIAQKKAKLKQLQNKATEEARKQLNIGK